MPDRTRLKLLHALLDGIAIQLSRLLLCWFDRVALRIRLSTALLRCNDATLTALSRILSWPRPAPVGQEASCLMTLRLQLSDRLLAKILLLILALTSMAIASPFASGAQNDEAQRVLVLHGIWNADQFQQAFDNSLAEELSLRGNYEISTHYLGLNLPTSDATLEVLADFVLSTVVEREVDLLVAVLPDAVNFLFALDLPSDLPKLLVLPSSEATKRAADDPNMAVVASSAPLAITGTLDQILQLRPQTETIEVLAGTDLSGRFFTELLQGYTDDYPQLQFNYYNERSPQEMRELVRDLDDSSTLFALPYNAYTRPDGSTMGVSRAEAMQVVQESAVPTFSFYENDPETGVVGGFMTSISDYANASAEQIQARLQQEDWRAPVMEGGANGVYDWPQIQRWGLNLDRLDGDYRIINQPPSLWETRRGLVLTVIYSLIILLLLIGFMGLMLHRSRLARLRIAESERQARESESKFSIVADNTLDVIWTWDSDSNRVIYCSPAVERVFGFTPAEYMAKNPRELVTPESFRVFEQLYQDPKMVGRIVEMEAFKKDGETLWVEMSVQPVRDQGPSHTWVGVTRDISRRKQLEADREAMEAAMRQNQKFESLGTLAGGIAHDFNNILAVIVGISGMLGQEVASNKRAAALLARLERSTERATGLVKQILTFSRQSDANRDVVDLRELVQDSIAILNAGLPANIRFERQITDRELPILADRVQIEQVILNIVTNAMQALESRPGRINIDLGRRAYNSPRRFTHGGDLQGEYALLEISDTGSGIESSRLEKIFDPFYTSKELGNGMGLAIVRGVVLKHGGAVDVISQPGTGTTFHIYLPLSKEKPKQVSSARNSHAEISQRRILIVDDNADLLDTMCMMVESLGHVTEAHADPAEALAMIEGEADSIDLVITDYSMPEISGLDILESCAKSQPDLPVVLCSGFGESLPESAEQVAGSSIRILQKPFNLAELESLFAELFSQDEDAEA